jgi:hypothetical protein
LNAGGAIPEFELGYMCGPHNKKLPSVFSSRQHYAPTVIAVFQLPKGGI